MRIRNFAIIAHIDHGKTTLTDCFLRLTQTTPSTQDRVLDSNPIERERGITIKLAPVCLQYVYPPTGEVYNLNLIDTPGHVDFSYEVSRSLAACEGVVLVVDATQGLQAQTLSHFQLAKQLGLAVVPVINKIDLPSADVERTMLEVMELTGVAEEDIICVSAKTGLNAAAVLDAVVEKIPAPKVSELTESCALLMSSHYDQHRGAIALIRVFSGSFAAGAPVRLLGSQVKFQPAEVGVFLPEMSGRKVLEAGEVGYCVTSLKDVRGLLVGDTLTTAPLKTQVEPLLGFYPPTPMVYLEVYPIESDEFELLKESLEKLVLRDAALQYTACHSNALGSGYRVGFLGILHAEIVLERLQREYDVALIATTPSVHYRVLTEDGTWNMVTSPTQFPDPSQIKQVLEPIANVNIITPTEYQHECLDLVRRSRGHFESVKPIGGRQQLSVVMPLAELITDFHDRIKSATSGFASLDYTIGEYIPADVIKVSIMLNKEQIEVLSFLTVRDQAEQRARKLVERLKEVLPRQMFEVAIQAALGGKIIARETLRAYRKDVTAKLYGGDVTRRKKLLAKQAKGKKRMKQFGSVSIDQQTFLELLKQ
ncbi:translation elongation factor 4 [Candidatus Woesebacteria bacterium]|nr:translation elongation factor 4 [Candidatus Woesebacteria bacterium]